MDPDRYYDGGYGELQDGGEGAGEYLLYEPDRADIPSSYIPAKHWSARHDLKPVRDDNDLASGFSIRRAPRARGSEAKRALSSKATHATPQSRPAVKSPHSKNGKRVGLGDLRKPNGKTLTSAQAEAVRRTSQALNVAAELVVRLEFRSPGTDVKADAAMAKRIHDRYVSEIVAINNGAESATARATSSRVKDGGPQLKRTMSNHQQAAVASTAFKFRLSEASVIAVVLDGDKKALSTTSIAPTQLQRHYNEALKASKKGVTTLPAFAVPGQEETGVARGKQRSSVLPTTSCAACGLTVHPVSGKCACV